MPSTKILKVTRFQIRVLARTIISFVRDVGIALGGWRRLGGFFYEYVLVFELPLSSATDSMATSTATRAECGAYMKFSFRPSSLADRFDEVTRGAVPIFSPYSVNR